MPLNMVPRIHAANASGIQTLPLVSPLERHMVLKVPFGTDVQVLWKIISFHSGDSLAFLLSSR